MTAAPVVVGVDGSEESRLALRWAFENAHLASDIGHRLIRQLAAATREPAMPGVELQQQREAQAGRSALAGHLPKLITNQRRILDQLILIDLTTMRGRYSRTP